MDSNFAVIDAAYNLLKAAEQNTNELSDLLNRVSRASEQLNQKTAALEATVAVAINNSIELSSDKISKRVLQELENANVVAMKAADRLDRASKRTFTYLAIIQLSFLILSTLVLWLFFIKPIPTIEEIRSLRAAKETLEKYGNVYDCGGKKCVELDVNAPKYYSEDKKIHLYVIKAKR